MTYRPQIGFVALRQASVQASGQVPRYKQLAGSVVCHVWSMRPMARIGTPVPLLLGTGAVCVSSLGVVAPAHRAPLPFLPQVALPPVTQVHKPDDLFLTGTVGLLFVCPPRWQIHRPEIVGAPS